jgi:hypothetical protein
MDYNHTSREGLDPNTNELLTKFAAGNQINTAIENNII